MAESKSAEVLTAAAPRPATAADAGITAFPAFVIELPTFSNFFPASSILERTLLVVSASLCKRCSSCSVSMISLCKASYLSWPSVPFSSCCFACSWAVFRASNFSFVAEMASFSSFCFWVTRFVLAGSSFRSLLTSFSCDWVFFIVELTFFRALSSPVVSPPISTVMPFILPPAMILTPFQGIKKTSSIRCFKTCSLFL